MSISKLVCRYPYPCQPQFWLVSYCVKPFLPVVGLTLYHTFLPHSCLLLTLLSMKLPCLGLLSFLSRCYLLNCCCYHSCRYLVLLAKVFYLIRLSPWRGHLASLLSHHTPCSQAVPFSCISVPVREQTALAPSPVVITIYRSSSSYLSLIHI